MSASQVWSNAVAYALQVGLVVGLGALVPAICGMRVARVRLLYWQVLLVACLTLPWVRPWQQAVVSGVVDAGGSGIVMASADSASMSNPDGARDRRTGSFPEFALWLLAAGCAIRLGGLGIGLARLGAYRKRGRRMAGEPGTYGVELLLSDDVAGPVTFGWRSPVILLPAGFPAMAEEMREAILCHELLHVERRDWLYTIGEEMVRAVLWFHPAVWWVIGEIQLAREQTVDRAVIETTCAPEPYVNALLLMAGATAPQLELATAPMFLRRRHLRKRLMEVASEVRMTTFSGTRVACVAGAAALMLAGACWLATGAFPLVAAPQTVQDAPGVSVDMNGSALMHRLPVEYPAEAAAKGVGGAVTVQVRLDADSEVSDANVLSGPGELRKAVLQSVLNWHFDRTLALTTQTVEVDFVKPVSAVAPGQKVEVKPVQHPPAPATRRLGRIVVTGLSDSARGELLSRLPVREGDVLMPEMLGAVRNAVSGFDSHLMTTLQTPAAGASELRIGLSPQSLQATYVAAAAPVNPPDFTGQADVYSVGNGTTPPTLVRKVDPGYSDEARAAKYSGTVLLSVVVGTDGRADEVRVVKSLGMGLDEKAVLCVRQWAFQPGTHEGVPVRVRAQVEINFQLL